jgi:hypothetical protein
MPSDSVQVISMDDRFARKVFRFGSPSREEIDIYRQQTRAFRHKFGREMGPDDPFFFDPDADTPRFRRPADAGYALERVADLMQQAGVDPAHVYAFRKTGGLLPPGATRLTPQEIEEWNAAVEEYNHTIS